IIKLLLSPAHPHSLKMFACSKFVSTPSLVKSTSWLRLTDESLSSLAVSRPLTSPVSSHSFQTSAISKDINTAAKFTGAGAATVGVASSGLIVGSTGNPSLKQQLFSYALLGFALSEAMGLFCLMVAFLILFAM
uniref:ATP synthase lipid-binding protein n=1 Tax=Saimiri boliviensis boliviensis TaxID=39432 RepID=A0A2K6TD53_SAIBB